MNLPCVGSPACIYPAMFSYLLFIHIGSKMIVLKGIFSAGVSQQNNLIYPRHDDGNAFNRRSLRSLFHLPSDLTVTCSWVGERKDGFPSRRVQCCCSFRVARRVAPFRFPRTLSFASELFMPLQTLMRTNVPRN